MLATDRDGDTLFVNRDGDDVWIEVSEIVGGEALNVVGVGPLTGDQVRDLRRTLGAPAPLRRLGRGVAWLGLASGPCALLCGATLGDAAGPWAAGVIASLVIAATLIHTTP